MKKALALIREKLLAVVHVHLYPAMKHSAFRAAVFDIQHVLRVAVAPDVRHPSRESDLTRRKAVFAAGMVDCGKIGKAYRHEQREHQQRLPPFLFEF